MATSLEQFEKHAADSGLLSSEEITAFVEGLPPDQRPQDAEGLARRLVLANKLTKYQAAAIYQGRPKGLVFGEYTVLEKIGSGGVGTVLKAEHRTMKRLVAVKTVSPDGTKSDEAIRRFYQEAEACARLTHPNIVTSFDAGEQDGIYYLVMEYVDGRDLEAIASEVGPLPVGEAVECILQAAQGLAYAHQQGIVHRDIKPSNLLVDTKGTVKILDMGLARVDRMAGPMDQTAIRLTQVGQAIGTCEYMSPEQAENTRGVDHRTDIYSLGCTVYRLLIGRPPYNGNSLTQTLLDHREAPIPSMRDVRPDVPVELDAVYRRMVAKMPGDRYQSASEVIAALSATVQPSKLPVAPRLSDRDGGGSFVPPAFGEPTVAVEGLSRANAITRKMVLPIVEGPANHRPLAPIAPIVDTSISGKVAGATRQGKTLILTGVCGVVAFLVLLGLLFVLIG